MKQCMAVAGEMKKATLSFRVAFFVCRVSGIFSGQHHLSMKLLFFGALSWIMWSLLGTPGLYAQATHAVCGFSQANPSAQQARLIKSKTQANPEDSIAYLVPVVFHVVWDSIQIGRLTVETNVHDSLIREQIAVLNEDYGRYGNGFNDDSVGADTRIRFALARRDPDGNPTSGITRQYNPEASRVALNDERKLKNLVRWDTRRYLNIWVVADIVASDTADPSGGNPGVIGGYAYLPQNHAGDNVDGIVVRWEQVGRGGRFRAQLGVEGRTTTHEAGHYFGLLHPWGPNENSGCREDDGLDDTPTCSGYQSALEYDSCGKELIQCGNRRMTENYMDYTPDSCKNIFTQQQRRLMRLRIRQFRTSLVSEENMLRTGLFETFQQLTPDARRDVVRIYPNPVEDRKIRLYASLEEPKTISLELLGPGGRQYFQQHFAKVETDVLEATLPAMRPGIYLYRLQYGQGTKTGKLLIR